MKTPVHPAIRLYLRENPDGATYAQIGAAIGKSVKTVGKAIAGMPDAYIDRWADPVRGQYQPVWCVVIPPANCPHPTERFVETNWNRRYFLPEHARQSNVGVQA